MPDDLGTREQREELERENQRKIAEADEANRKKNEELREATKTRKAAKAERERLLEIPPTLFEMEQLVRVRNTYMKKVVNVFFMNQILRELSHESKNRVQRMLTWRKKVEAKELLIEQLRRSGAGDDILDPIRKEKNEYLAQALLNWFASVEMYRKFKAEEFAELGRQRKNGNKGTD